MVNPFLQDYTLLTPRKDVKVLQTILNYLNIWDSLIIWCGQKNPTILVQFFRVFMILKSFKYQTNY